MGSKANASKVGIFGAIALLALSACSSDATSAGGGGSDAAAHDDSAGGGDGSSGQDSAAGQDASTGDDASTGGDSSAGHDSSTADSSSHDATTEGGGGAAFGATCTTDANCASHMCRPFRMMSVMICTKACTVATQTADCPNPPSAGTCTNNGYCRFN